MTVVVSVAVGVAGLDEVEGAGESEALVVGATKEELGAVEEEPGTADVGAEVAGTVEVIGAGVEPVGVATPGQNGKVTYEGSTVFPASV